MLSRRDSPLWGQAIPSALRLLDRKENCDALNHDSKPRGIVESVLQASAPQNLTLTRLPAPGIGQSLDGPKTAWLGQIPIDQPKKPAAAEHPTQTLSRRLTNPSPGIQTKKIQEEKTQRRKPIAATRHSHRLAGRDEKNKKMAIPWKMASPPRKQPPVQKPHPKQPISLSCASPGTALCVSAASVLLSLATSAQVACPPHNHSEEMLHLAPLDTGDTAEKNVHGRFPKKEDVFFHPSSSYSAPTLPFATISPPLEQQNDCNVLPTVAMHGHGNNCPWVKRRALLVKKDNNTQAVNMPSKDPAKERISSLSVFSFKHGIAEMSPLGGHAKSASPVEVVCAPPRAVRANETARRKRSRSPANAHHGAGNSAEKRIKGHIEIANDLLRTATGHQENLVHRGPCSSNPLQGGTPPLVPSAELGFLQFRTVSEALVGSDLVRRWLSLQMEKVSKQMRSHLGASTNAGVSPNPSRLEIAAGSTAFPAETYNEMLPVLRQCETIQNVQMLVHGLKVSGGLGQLVETGNIHLMLAQRDKVARRPAAGGGGGGAEGKNGGP